MRHKELGRTCCSLIIVVLTGYNYSTACIHVYKCLELVEACLDSSGSVLSAMLRHLRYL